MTKTQKYLGLAGWLALCFLTGWIGAQFRPGEWYAGLTKPAFTPPGWVFPIAWNLLYLMMGVAAWLVWLRGRVRDIRLPISLFIIQLVINGSWSWVFFGLHQLTASVAVIAMLCIFVAATMITFWRVSRAAGWLIVPYLAWISFASVLNLLIWRYNR